MEGPQHTRGVSVIRALTGSESGPDNASTRFFAIRRQSKSAARRSMGCDVANGKRRGIESAALEVECFQKIRLAPMVNRRSRRTIPIHWPGQNASAF
jgi:hypothetical protein